MIPLSWSIPTDDLDESFEKEAVMLAVEGDGDDRTTVIADATNEEAYLAMPYDESHTLSQWR